MIWPIVFSPLFLLSHFVILPERTISPPYLYKRKNPNITQRSTTLSIISLDLPSGTTWSRVVSHWTVRSTRAQANALRIAQRSRNLQSLLFFELWRIAIIDCRLLVGSDSDRRRSVSLSIGAFAVKVGGEDDESCSYQELSSR